MKQFGKITRIHISKDKSHHKNHGFTAFVDFKTFAEASAAVRTLNSPENSGLQIKAEMSYSLREINEIPYLNPPEERTVNQLQDEDVNFLENFSVLKWDNLIPTNENIEKVTQFEFQRRSDAFNANFKSLLSNLEKSSLESKWDVNNNDNSSSLFTYNKKIFSQNFLNFPCSQCDRLAVLKDREKRKYFCSMKCFTEYETPKTQTPDQKKLIQSDKVIITAILSEKCLFVRHADEEYVPALENVYRLAKNNLTKEEKPKINHQVLVKVDDDIFRGNILEKLSSTEFLVQLTDIGNTIKVLCNDLFEMNLECYQLPKLITKVTLKNVNINSINMNIINYLCDLRDNQTELTIKTISNENCEVFVELKDNNGNFVNDKIMQLSDVVLEEGKVADISCVPYLIPEVGKNLRLFCITKIFQNANYFGCLDEKYLKDFYQLQKALNDYGKKVIPSTFGFTLNELCLLQIKNQWYRGIVTEAVGDGNPICLLVDFMESYKVPVESIFSLPHVFVEYPFYAENYKVHDYDKMNEEEKNAVDKYIRKYDFFKAHEVFEGQEPSIVFNLNDLMSNM